MADQTQLGSNNFDPDPSLSVFEVWCVIKVVIVELIAKISRKFAYKVKPIFVQRKHQMSCSCKNNAWDNKMSVCHWWGYFEATDEHVEYLLFFAMTSDRTTRCVLEFLICFSTCQNKYNLDQHSYIFPFM